MRKIVNLLVISGMCSSLLLTQSIFPMDAQAKDKHTDKFVKTSEKLVKKYHKTEKERISGLKPLLSEYQATTNQVHELSDKKKKVEKTLNDTKLKHLDKGEDIDKVENRINKIIERYNLKEKERIKKESDISLTKKEIRDLETKLAARETSFRERIKNSREDNKFMRYIQVILNSRSFGDMVMQYQMVKKISAEDNRLIEEYIGLQNQLNEKKKSLEKEKRLLDSILLDLRKIKKESEKELKKLNGEQRDILKKIHNLHTSLEKVDKKLVSKKEVQKDLTESIKKEIQFVKDYKSYRIKDVDGLDSYVQRLLSELIRRCEDEHLYIKVTDGYRSFDEQNKLYSQGRSSSGKVVTNAKGGESYHNYGLAVDVAFKKGNTVTWEQYDMNHNDVDDWKEIGKIGEDIGFEWGGNWTSLVDRPHFQYTYGKTLNELYEEVTGKSMKHNANVVKEKTRSK